MSLYLKPFSLTKCIIRLTAISTSSSILAAFIISTFFSALILEYDLYLRKYFSTCSIALLLTKLESLALSLSFRSIYSISLTAALLHNLSIFSCIPLLMLKRSASSVFSFIFSPVPIVTVQLSVEQYFNSSSISLYCIGVNPVNPSSIILAPFIKLLSFIYFTSMSGISSVLIYLSFV